MHPMIQALNALDYDVWVTGNHEYDYGMDITKKAIADVEAEVLTGNVYDENGRTPNVDVITEEEVREELSKG